MENVFLSNSLRSKATACQRAFWFYYFEGLIPKKTETYFFIGSLWHEMMETLFKNKDALGHNEAIHLVWNLWAEKREAALAKTIGEEAYIKTSKIFETLQAMFKSYYLEMWDSEKDWEVLGVEIPFRLSLGTSNKTRLLTQDDPPRKNEFVGIIDLVIRNHKGQIWAVERKTTSSRDSAKYEMDCNYDWQPVGYVLAVQEMADAYWGGGEVLGLYYQVARTSVPQKPSINQCKNCKGKGLRPEKVILPGNIKGERTVVCDLCGGSGRGALSLKFLTNTTAEALSEVEMDNPQIQKAEYAQWFAEEYLPFKNSVLGASKPFHWAFQHIVTQAVRKDWVRDTISVAQNIRALGHKKPNQFVRTLSRYLGGCSQCVYKDLCFDDSLYLREMFFDKKDLRAALPKELQERLGAGDIQEEAEGNGLEWL